MLAFAKSHGSRQVLGPYLLEGYDPYPYHPIPSHTSVPYLRSIPSFLGTWNLNVLAPILALESMLCEQWMPWKARNMQKGTPRSLLHGFQIDFSFFSKTTRTLSSPCLLMADRLCARLVRSFPHIQCSFLSRSHFIWLKQSADFCSLYPVVNFCDRFFFKESTASTFKNLQILASYKFGSADADIHSQDPFICSINLYRHSLGEPQGATILYRLRCFFLGTSACRSHEKPPNQTKDLEDATKWPHKLDRKILDWPGSSKATSHPKAGRWPWDGLCSFAAPKPLSFCLPCVATWSHLPSAWSGYKTSPWGSLRQCLYKMGWPLGVCGW